MYVREYNDSNVQAMITWLTWTTWTSLSAVRERPLNFIIHSLTHSKELTTDTPQRARKGEMGMSFVSECHKTSQIISQHGFR